MASADLGGVQLHYELTGDASLPVLVLSNSLGVNLRMWQAQMDALAGRFRLLRYDTRGHGQSSVAAGPYTIADLGMDVLGLLDALGLEQVCFCGLSMGGATGQWLGINAPDRLRKLVLANTAAKIGTAAGWDARIATVLESGLGNVIPGTLERWFTEEFRAAHSRVVAETGAMLQATSAEGYAACCAAIRDVDFRASLASIETSTLVISGAFDPVTSPADGQYLAAHIPGAKYVELPAAHLSNVEAADQFNGALLDFLGE
jgi:3-oxoadipate enol-lactonase